MTTASSSTAFARIDAFFRTSTGRLVAVACVSAGVASVSILSYQSARRRVRRSKLRDQVDDVSKREIEQGGDEELVDFSRPPPSLSRLNSTSTTSTGTTSQTGRGKKPTSEVIIKEALARNYVFFGEEGMSKVRNAFVVVVGCGGVGSAAATMLVRSGVRKIRLIDFDQVSLSSLNRHASATLADVGTPKVTSLAAYFGQIAPWVEVDARIELFNADTASALLDEGSPDWVLDCIDNIDSKVDLLAHCARRGTNVFASLGAACKSDPSRIQIADISTTYEDPLARSVRRRLKLKGVHSAIPVVYSTEKPRAELALLPLPDEEYEKGNVGELSALSNFRVRILPVIGSLPAMFGNAAATYVLQRIAGFEMEPLPVKNRTKLSSAMHRFLSSEEEKLTGSNLIPLKEDDMQYILDEIHRGRSVVPPHNVPQRPSVTRWRKSEGLRTDNLVVFDRQDALKHQERCVLGNEDPEQVWGAEVTECVKRRAEEERRVRKWRI